MVAVATTIDDFRLPVHDGVITVRNTKRDTHRTFRIRTQKDDAKFAPGRRILSLLTGPDNTRSYTQIAWIEGDGSIRLWAKYQTEHYHNLICILTRIDHWQKCGVEYMFAGRCRRCQRPLTRPDSISSGIGPECAKVIG